MNGSDPKQTARDLLAEAQPALVGLSHWIHANPELGYEEVLASGWVAEWMAAAGFEVRRGVAGLETALAASYGPGPFHVVLCAEYDALPAVGHACGHNVIAASSVGAAIALAAVSEELGLRVTLLGTPAEEGGGGKLALIDAGELDGVHAALMIHPGPDDIVEPELLGVRTLNVTYTGREAHAAGFPELGINAADALVVAQAAIGLLRQHLDQGDRVHGIVTKGGDAPNIVPAHTSGTFMVRSRTRDGLDALTARVIRCFEAGAIATGSELSVVQEVAYSPMRHDPDLAGLYRTNAEAMGRWFDPTARLVVSTDMGDVSHVVPSIHPIIGIDSRPAVNHQPEFAAAAVSPAADQAIFDGALLLAWTVIDAASDASIRERLTGEAWAGALPGTFLGDDTGSASVEDATSDGDDWAASGPEASFGDAWATIEAIDAATILDDAAGVTPWPEPEITVVEVVLVSEEAEEPAGEAEEPAVEAAPDDERASDDGSANDEFATDEVAQAAESAAEVAWSAEPSGADVDWQAAGTAEPSADETATPVEQIVPAEELLGDPEDESGDVPADTEELAGGPSGPEPGDEHAQWEADFAAALESLDRAAADGGAAQPSPESGESTAPVSAAPDWGGAEAASWSEASQATESTEATEATEEQRRAD
ncbi:MAG: hypothetical protein QOH61_405 [Chloroflexota bacterium]|jgi:amidohydrolase|nr:hypothetical protein [Chloroflexota bacterium]